MTNPQTKPQSNGRKRASFETRRRRRRVVAWAAFALSLAIMALSAAQFIGAVSSDAVAQDVRPPSNAVNVGTPPAGPSEAVEGRVPGNVLGSTSDSGLWRGVRNGERYSVSIPNKTAGYLVQSEGEEWRALRNGSLSNGYLYAIGGMIALLALFYLVRGRIQVEHGMAGRTIQRFTDLERFGHWLLAGSFILLALTGLNLLYGRYFLLPVIGPDAFSALTLAGKWVHNNVAWAFMLGLVLVFVFWVRHNIPSMVDVKWLAKGGGLFAKGVHPDARKFNAGQKMIFWATILLGASVSLSGIALLFPFETAMMSKTFAIFNIFGAGLSTELTPMQEMQYQTTWHGIVAVAMIAIIIAHIYIGSLGMEGAFDAMGAGQVDINWAREHHNLWVEEVEAEAKAQPGQGGAATPAE